LINLFMFHIFME